MVGKRAAADTAAAEDGGGAAKRACKGGSKGAGVKKGGEAERKDVIATFRLPLKQWLYIVQNVGLVSDTCTIRTTPDELCLHSQCGSLTLAALGRFPPSFFLHYECFDARDVTVNSTHWKELLKVAKDTLKGEIFVDISIVERGNMLFHDFFTCAGGGDDHVTVHEHHLPACETEQEDFVLTISDRAISVTVATSEWRTTMDQLFKLSNDVKFCVTEKEVRVDYMSKTRGYGVKHLKPGNELSSITMDDMGDRTEVTQIHRVEKVKKAAHIVGADELVLRFVPDGPLEQHCAIGEKGRIIIFVCGTTDD
jgi:hypothetical protein